MTPDRFLTAYGQAWPDGPRIIFYTQASARNLAHRMPVSRLTVTLETGRRITGTPDAVHRRLLDRLDEQPA
jgi:hypothetical protein